MAVTTGPRAHGMVRQVAAVLRGEGNTRDGTYVRRLGGKVGAAVDAMPHIAVNEADVPLSAGGTGSIDAPAIERRANPLPLLDAEDHHSTSPLREPTVQPPRAPVDARLYLAKAIAYHETG